MRSTALLLLSTITITVFFTRCEKKKTILVWEKNIYRIGSQSSPRATDLNQDVILDIVIGAGKNEYEFSEQGIIALDGHSGEILWQHETEDQVFGSATFLDITGDGIDDVFIGGRSPNFRAINGETGELIWKYHYHYEEDPILQYARFNFYNAALIPDQNQDGIQDLLVLNGGNSKAMASDSLNRFPGVLMVLSARSGAVIAADTMPDGRESYLSPVVYRQPGSDDLNIIFGSGGETLDGSLYLTTVSDLMKINLEGAEKLASDRGHGFISPPVLVDLNKDGWLDVVAISHGSYMIAIDGMTRDEIWSGRIEGTECSSGFAVGHFNNDEIPDLFINVGKGVWPNSTSGMQFMINGRTGKPEFQDSLGCTGFSSPVVYDLNGDHIDEVLLSINKFDCQLGFTGQKEKNMQHELIYFDFTKDQTMTIDQGNGFKNFFSTPYIGDLDGDHYLDIIYCQYYHTNTDPLLFLGMTVKRISTDRRIQDPVVWGSYMGSRGDGIYRTSKADN